MLATAVAQPPRGAVSRLDRIARDTFDAGNVYLPFTTFSLSLGITIASLMTADVAASAVIAMVLGCCSFPEIYFHSAVVLLAGSFMSEFSLREGVLGGASFITCS